MKKTFYLLTILALLLLPTTTRDVSGTAQFFADVILYVAPGGSGECTSWEDACDLQYALSMAESGSEIWVQAGVYKPTAGTDRTVSFALESGVALYGGFAGTESQREQRDWQTNLTTLSGDLGVEGDASDNSYHVVTGDLVDAAATLDGFTITAGNANGSSPHVLGGGMYNVNSSPTLTDVTFSGNTAAYGGGMYNNGSSPSLINVTFSGNTAYSKGGGMYNSYSSPTLTNVTFSGNVAYSAGGGMYNYDGSNPSLANAILWGNTPNPIHNESSTPVITYSDIQGGCPVGATCTEVMSLDPQFVRNPSPGADGTWGTPDDDYGDLRLQPTSPAIDAGNNDEVPAGITTDLLGAPRFVDIPTIPDTGYGDPPIVDMGAYEVQITVVRLPNLIK